MLPNEPKWRVKGRLENGKFPMASKGLHVRGAHRTNKILEFIIIYLSGVLRYMVSLRLQR